MKDTKSRHITPIDGNVFADMGFDPKEAATLKTEARRVISDRLSRNLRRKAEQED